MKRTANSAILILTALVLMSYLNYPTTFLDYDHDLRYWVHVNRVKKITCSPENQNPIFGWNEITEYSFSQHGELIEEREYLEFYDDISLRDTVPIFNDHKRFFDPLGVKHQRYYLNGEILRKIQLNDTNGNLVYCFYKHNPNRIIHGKFLTKSIKYTNEKSEIEILNFDYLSNSYEKFDTLSFVKLRQEINTNTISVSVWLKDPLEQDPLATEKRITFYNEKTWIELVLYELKKDPYRKIIESTFGKNGATIFEGVQMTNTFDMSRHQFTQKLEASYTEYQVQNAFSQYRRYLFTASNPDSIVVFQHGYPQIQAETVNDQGKLIRRYAIYGPIETNPPELIELDQYNHKDELTESYRLWQNGWHKWVKEYSEGYVVKQTHYRQKPDSTIDSTSYIEKKAYDYFGNYLHSYRIHHLKSECDHPQQLQYLRVFGEDYLNNSRIQTVGDKGDTMINFMTADSSGRIYTVEYW